MNDNDLAVEEILREIKLRVQGENGVNPEDTDIVVADRGQRDRSAFRIQTYLAVTDRTRADLPPVRTYRSGTPARIELWIKRQIRRATRWFTIDQVNFNTAAHDILTELYEMQARQEQIISALERPHLNAVGILDSQKAIADDLALRISESAIMIDRMRRNFEHRLAKLEKE